MYTIIMNKDKSLSKTEIATLYQGENLVDKFRFLLPLMYEDSDLSEFTNRLKYIDPANIIHNETLVLSDELYKDCMLCYYLPVDSKLTKFAGDISMHITLENGDKKLYTSETTVSIKPTKYYYQLEEDDSEGEDNKDNEDDDNQSDGEGSLDEYDYVTETDIDSLFGD